VDRFGARVGLVVALTVAALACGLPGSAAAGPWTPEPGGGYVKAWLHWLPGLAYHAGPEAPEPGLHGIGAYQELGVGTWAEFGVAEGLAVTAHWMPVRTFVLPDPAGGEVGAHVTTGEPEVGVRLRVVRFRRFVASLEAGVRAPVGDGRVRQEVRSTADGNPVVGGLRIDSGVWDGRLGVSVGLGFDRRYGAASCAVILRSDGFDALLVWSVEAGGPLGTSGRWSGRLRAAAQHPLGNGDAPYAASPSGIGNGARYFGFTAEVERTLSERWTVGASVAASFGLAARQAHGPSMTLFAAHRF